MSLKKFLDALVDALPPGDFDKALKTAEDKGIRQFYLPTWGDNVWNRDMSLDFQRMYNEGDGNELLCKACAIHSSSMLAYNFFHWINASKNPKAIFQFDGIKFDRVVFEVEIPCLWKSKKGKPTRAKDLWKDFVRAYMDIMLVGKKGNKCHVFFLESKFTEHFSSESSGMRKMESKYDTKDRYVVKAYDMPDVVKKFINEARKKGRSKAYYDGIKQSICHLIAMTNLVDDEAIRKEFTKKYGIIDESPCFHFANLLFKPDEERFKDEARYYDEYCKLYEEFYKSIDKKYPAGLDVRREPLSYTTVWNKMKNTLGTINERLKEYLEERYMSVASKEF